MNAKGLIIAGFLIALIPGTLSAQIDGSPHDLVISSADDSGVGIFTRLLDIFSSSV